MAMDSFQTDGKSLMASSSSSGGAAAARVMEKPISQEQTQQQQPPLKCPRCESSNTKFCYYNNYSLSQPRHFCKACKRYWTRGGTLRNVPVGGGCRKNKRIRRSSSSSSPAAIDVSSSSTSPAASSAPLQISAPTPPPQPKTQINPLFYGLPINPSELNLSFPRLFGSRVSGSDQSCLSSGYDNNHDSNNYSMISSTGFLGGQGENGFVNSSLSNPLLSSYPVFRSSSSTTLASLIASSLEQRKFNASGDITTSHERCNSNFLGMPYGESAMAAGNIILENGELLKGVKMEGETQNRSNWNDAVPMNHQILQTKGVVNINNYSTSSSDPPSFPWNGAWMDPSSMGSSLPAFSHLAS